MKLFELQPAPGSKKLRKEKEEGTGPVTEKLPEEDTKVKMPVPEAGKTRI